MVLARENGISQRAADAAVTSAVEAYRRRMRRYTTMPELDIWYDGVHVDSLISFFEPADRGRVEVHIEKKQKRRTNRGAFAKLTEMVHGRPRITEEPPIRVGISDARTGRPRRPSAGRLPADAAGRSAGPVRSVHRGRHRSAGGRCRQRRDAGLFGAFEGRTGADPLFLQVKQAGPSVYEAHLQPSQYDNHGHG